MTTGPFHRIMNEREAARRLNLSVETLRNWRFQRRGPNYVKFGRRVAYIESDLTDYIEARRIVIE